MRVQSVEQKKWVPVEYEKSNKYSMYFIVRYNKNWVYEIVI